MNNKIYTQALEPEQEVCLASGKKASFCAYVTPEPEQADTECEIEVGSQKLRLPQHQIFLPGANGPTRRWILGKAEIEWHPQTDHLIYRGPIVALSPDGLWYHRQRFYRNEALPEDWDNLTGWDLVQNWLWRLNPELTPPQHIQAQLDAAFNYRNPQPEAPIEPNMLEETEAIVQETVSNTSSQTYHDQTNSESISESNSPLTEVRAEITVNEAIEVDELPETPKSEPLFTLSQKADEHELAEAQDLVKEQNSEKQDEIHTQADDALLQASQKELDQLSISGYPPSLRHRRSKSELSPVEVHATSNSEDSAFETMISEQVKEENKSNPLKTIFFLFLGFMIMRGCLSALF